MSDLLDVRGGQALEAAKAKLADLEEEERYAIARGDAEAAADRRAERMLLEEAALMLQQRREQLAHHLEALPRPERKARGPKPMTSALEVARTRQRLKDAGKPYGERTIALELGVSRDAVRYALGKDRRQPRE